jgi:outer membrane protein assembly factor BamB
MLPAQRSLGVGQDAPLRSTASIGQVDWPTFAFSAHRDGSNPYEDILTPTTVGSLQVAWTSDIGGDGFLQPVLSRGMLYEALFDGTIVAMAASTGATVWTAHVDPGIFMEGVAVANGFVYAGAGDGLWALDALTGSVVWQNSPGAQNYGPLVRGKRVYAGGDGTVSAANGLSGRLAWKRLIQQDSSFFTIALGGRDLFLTSFNSFVVRVDSGTGKVVGGISLPVAETDDVSWHAGTEFVGAAGQTGSVFAVDPSTDQILWQFDTSNGDYVFGPPAVQDGVVYTDSSGPTGGHVYALNAKTGGMIWSYEAPNGIPGVSVAGGVVYAAADDGIIRALDAASGDLLWSFNTGSRVAQPPIIANGMVYAATGGGLVYAFDLPAEGGR